MVVKRKRSDSEISSASSLLSSPLSNSLMAIDSFSSQNQIQTPSLFSARTRKRHRDNRPSESDVHCMPLITLPSAEPLALTPETVHTLSLLYSAQRNQQPVAPMPAPTHRQPLAGTYSQSFPTQALPASNQPSLHSFFAIPNSHARHSSPSSESSNASSYSGTPIDNATMHSFFQATNCEDCDASLNTPDGDAMDVDMMDIDVNANGGNYACESCGKNVCHGCAVSNLGEQRRCLHCAGKRGGKLVGGFRWMP